MKVDYSQCLKTAQEISAAVGHPVEFKVTAGGVGVQCAGFIATGPDFNVVENLRNTVGAHYFDQRAKADKALLAAQREAEVEHAKADKALKTLRFM